MDKSLIITTGVLLCAYAGTLALRIEVVDPHAEARKLARIPEEAAKSPGPEVMKLVSFEYGHAISDIVWLGIVQELGGRPTERSLAAWDRIYRWSEIATDLDPRYFTIYHTSAVQLTAWGRRASDSDALLLKGAQNLSTRWEFPFMLGYNAYFLHGDAAVASQYWESAILLPNAPRFTVSLAARARFQSGDEGGAIGVLEALLEAPGLDEAQREDAGTRLKLLKSEQFLRDYDAACKVFQAKNGRVPRDGAELYEAKLVEHAPFNLIDEPILIDAECRARTQNGNLIREDEAAKTRIGSQAATETATETETETEQ